MLEDDHGFVELACPSTGILAWPTIRAPVFRLLLGDRLYPTAPLVATRSRPSVRRVLMSGIRAAVHNLRNPPQRSEVLVVATGAGLIPRDGLSFNRYTDHFAAFLGRRAWTMESTSLSGWPSPPRSNPRHGFLAAHKLVLASASRVAVRPRHAKVARDLVDLATDRGRDVLGWVLTRERRDFLIRSASRQLATYPIQADLWRRLLRRVQPAVALIEEGCYGHMAVFNAVARHLGVNSTEFQHGMVTRGHDVYNVAPALAGSDAYRLTQPRSFLSYGVWWNNQFNAPVEDRVAVGYPHRVETLRTWTPSPARRNVLVLGDGVETNTYLKFCRELAELVSQGVEVTFRPHPWERSRVAHEGSVRIDQTSDLYDSLAGVDAVVGEVTTVLFEAVGLVPRIFVWDTSKSRFHLGDHPFARFADARGLAELLQSPAGGNVPDDLAGSFWSTEWRENLERFLAGHDRK